MSFRINTNIQALTALRNLNTTSQMYGQSVTRLSTGLRINSAAEDPAGLIISENFRAQISSLEAAQRNNQDAINMAKTAEGALDEVSRLLRDARSLAISSSNTGVVSASQLQANQVQLNSIIESITRISTSTSFGTKRLLDGSAGTQANPTDATKYKSLYFVGNFNGTTITTNTAVTIDVTTLAEPATHTGTQAFNTGDLVGSGQFILNGVSFSTDASTTVEQLVAKLNQESDKTGVTATHTNGQGVLLKTFNYGTSAHIQLTDPQGILQNGSPLDASVTGVDAIASVTINNPTPVSVLFTGGLQGRDGLTLTDADGNVITLAQSGNVGGAAMAGQMIVGLSQFQIGANAGQTAQMSLGNFSSASLQMTGLDVTTRSGAGSALTAIDNAIDFVSRSRGTIGAFQRNVLESNLRSLAVAHENLSDSESTIRDVDMAAEMATFTKLQILQQSGMAALAQANNSNQAVLSLLRG